MIKDFTNKECCLTCRHFCFWDGDYCCTSEMKIHQFGWYPENAGAIWFTRDIDKTMETPETCEDYSYAHHEKYPESKNIYKQEYKKFKVWDKLCNQLEEHVHNNH